MNLLAFDTALGRGSVAVVVDGRVAAQRIEHEPRALAERLVPMIEETLEAAGESYQSMDRLAVTVGPGTFTGTRIGVATARGLGLATGLPVIGISTLEALAAAVDAVDVGASIAAAIDARRGQVYLQIFLRTADGIEPVREPAAVDLDGIGDVVSGHDGAAVGPGAEIVARASAGHLPAIRDSGKILPGVVARLAVERDAPIGPVRPLYLRKPDAKLPGGQAVAS